MIIIDTFIILPSGFFEHGLLFCFLSPCKTRLLLHKKMASQIKKRNFQIVHLL